MKRASILLAALIALTGAARATGLTGYACQGWGLTVLTGPAICGTAPSPPAGNALLLEDNTSILLLEDGTSYLCLEGGC